MNKQVMQCVEEFEKGNLWFCKTPSGDYEFGPDKPTVWGNCPIGSSNPRIIYDLVIQLISSSEAELLTKFFAAFGRYTHLNQKKGRNAEITQELVDQEVSILELSSRCGLSAGYLKNVIRGTVPISEKNKNIIIDHIREIKANAIAPQL